MAFGTITGILKRSIVKQGRPSMAVLELTCTAGTAGEAGAFPATIINPLAVDSVGSLFDLRGVETLFSQSNPRGYGAYRRYRFDDYG